MSDVDASSALFLGFRHPTAALRPWRSLTTGLPAVIGEATSARQVAGMVATRQGAEAGLVARSTLHALVDVLGDLPGRGDVVAVDAAAYPLSHWAAMFAGGRGARVLTYPHHRPDRVRPRPAGRLFVVTDGRCPGCQRVAPLAELRAMAAARDGLLVVDDSLAFGVLGARRADDPFGDGAGTPSWLGTGHDGVLWVASLAKAYGAPLTVVTGDAGTIEHLGDAGGNRVHSSPPSSADLAAAARALTATDLAAARRRRLSRYVHRLRAVLRSAGVTPEGGPFPIVSVWFAAPRRAYELWRRLRARGVRAVVQVPRCRGGALLSVLVRADHRPEEIDRIAAGLRPVLGQEVAPCAGYG